MKNALKRLDELITDTLSPEYLMTGSFTSEQVTAWLQEACAGKENIRRELMYPDTGSIHSLQGWGLHIRSYQSAITYLADLVWGYLEESLLPELERLYERLLQLLTQLLSLIYQRFRMYCNRDEKIPAVLQEGKRKKLEEQLQEFNLAYNGEIRDTALYAAVSGPFTSFIGQENLLHFSYRRVGYLSHLLKTLNELPWQEGITGTEVIRELVRMNCNSNEVSNYLFEKIEEELMHCTTAKQKHQKLGQWQAFFRGIPVWHQMAWEKGMVSLGKELLEWIAELLGREEEGVVVKKKQSKTGETGLYYKMTVEELALRKRVERDAGYLSNRNITEMMQDLASVIHSVNTYEVSWQDLYNLFFNYNLQTVKSLTEKAFVMARILHKLEMELKKKKRNN